MKHSVPKAGALLVGFWFFTTAAQAASPLIGCTALQSWLEQQLSGTSPRITADGAECAANSDAEKMAHRCAWTFPLASDEARQQFEATVVNTRTCLGERASERIGEPVNHPDAFVAHYFTLSNAVISVSLKHKAALRATLVSVRVDNAVKN